MLQFTAAAGFHKGRAGALGDGSGREVGSGSGADVSAGRAGNGGGSGSGEIADVVSEAKSRMGFGSGAGNSPFTLPAGCHDIPSVEISIDGVSCPSATRPRTCN